MTMPEHDLKAQGAEIDRMHKKSARLISESNALIGAAGDVRRQADGIRRMAGRLEHQMNPKKESGNE